MGRPVIEGIVAERAANGNYKTLEDFITRTSELDINKRVIENMIKAGAFDSLPGTRKQKMFVYAGLVDRLVKDKKNNLVGQMSLFDLVGEEEKSDFHTPLPDVGEFDRQELLAYEKEVVGFYISGHPLEEYKTFLERRITAKTSDFYRDEETGEPKVTDGKEVVIGGILTDKKIKYTKNNKIMAFLMIEDLYGSIEVVIFPRDYERNQSRLEVDGKIFVQGRVQLEDEKDGKLIGSVISRFDEMPRRLAIGFADKDSYLKQADQLTELLKGSEGKDSVLIVCKKERVQKLLPPNQNIHIEETLLERLSAAFGKDNIKVL